jgi:hypothetical protein
MAGLVPAIHVFHAASAKAWMRGTSPGTSPRMTMPHGQPQIARSGGSNHGVIQRTRCVFESGSDVIFLEIGEIVQYFRSSRSTGQQIQNIGDANALAADTWSPTTNLRIGCYSIETFHSAPSWPSLGRSLANLIARDTIAISGYPIYGFNGAVK